MINKEDILGKKIELTFTINYFDKEMNLIKFNKYTMGGFEFHVDFKLSQVLNYIKEKTSYSQISCLSSSSEYGRYIIDVIV